MWSAEVAAERLRGLKLQEGLGSAELTGAGKLWATTCFVQLPASPSARLATVT